MSKTIKWTLDTGFIGGVHEGEIIVGDSASDDEIEDRVKEDIFDYYIGLEWEEKK